MKSLAPKLAAMGAKPIVEIWSEISSTEKAFDEMCKRLQVESEQKDVLNSVFIEWCSSDEFNDLLKLIKTLGSDANVENKAVSRLENICISKKFTSNVSTKEIIESFFYELDVHLRSSDPIYRSRKEVDFQRTVLAELDSVKSLFKADFSRSSSSEVIRQPDELELHAQVDLAVKHINRLNPKKGLEILKSIDRRSGLSEDL